ncbi:mitochondrial carrier domain-containing protein [Zopfochytrium polystomum]|nr:mitochondrial carrier domain-containing protein [Zopfochytrium polystomum]
MTAPEPRHPPQEQRPPPPSAAASAPSPPTFLFGAVGGICHVLISHPFDLVKGVSPVLLGAGPVMGICYYSFATSRSLLFGAESLDAPLAVWQTAVAGGVAAIPTSLVLGPAERVKILLQMGHTTATSSLSSPSATPASSTAAAAAAAPAAARAPPVARLASLLRANAVSSAGPPPRSAVGPARVLRGLFRGTGMTMMRDVPGDAAYFGVNEATRQLLRRVFGGGGDGDGGGRPLLSSSSSSPSPIPAAHVLIAGGIAGCANWLVCIPIDTVKTRIQQQQEQTQTPRTTTPPSGGTSAAVGCFDHSRHPRNGGRRRARCRGVLRGSWASADAGVSGLGSIFLRLGNVAQGVGDVGCAEGQFLRVPDSPHTHTQHTNQFQQRSPQGFLR